MKVRYEYLVCLVQQGRVTWVNGKWAGTVPLSESGTDSGAALESCLNTWDFLNERGSDEWELVAVSAELVHGEVTGFFSDQLELKRTTTLFLKRPSTR
jgi:hypothetical protein